MMKKTKKLLRTLIVLVLVFFSLSSGMTVGAVSAEKNAKYCKEAFSFVKVNGKKVSAEYGYVVLDTSKKKVPVKVKLKKGWKLKKISYKAPNGKTVKVKNGGQVKVKEVLDNILTVEVKKGSKSAKWAIEVASGEFG